MVLDTISHMNAMNTRLLLWHNHYALRANKVVTAVNLNENSYFLILRLNGLHKTSL